jgi:ubiquinone/menaquinone biosynthesis C-methylase UbiE
MASELKDDVRQFWDAASCGEIYASRDADAQAFYESHRARRYELEKYLPDFAQFGDFAGKDVLEIGVGMGADHAEIAKASPRSLHGIDLTPRAVQHTAERLRLLGLHTVVNVADAERLPFDDASFDRVYSWGVIHHSPDTQGAANEIFRVLRPGGTARVMIYHTHSLVGAMLWLRYGLCAGRPGRSLADIYFHHLESPGTKAYTVAQARQLFARFTRVRVRAQLSFADLLEGSVGVRHRGHALRAAKALWPRWAIRRWGGNLGLYLLIDAVK